MSKITDKLHVLESSLTDIHDVLESKLPIGGGGTELPPKLKVSEISSYIEKIESDSGIKFKINISCDDDSFNGKTVKATQGETVIQGIIENRKCTLEVSKAGNWTISQTANTDTVTVSIDDEKSCEFKAWDYGSLQIKGQFINTALACSGAIILKGQKGYSQNIPRSWGSGTTNVNSTYDNIPVGSITIQIKYDDRTFINTTKTINKNETTIYDFGLRTSEPGNPEEPWYEGMSTSELLPNESIEIPINIEESETNEQNNRES